MQEVILFIQHHSILFFALLLVAILAAIIEYIRIRREAAHLSPSKVVMLMNRDNAVVVDVRTKDAWSKGHITNAVSLPLGELQQNNKINKFRTQPIIIVCANGNDSKTAAALLQAKGFNVHILSGGMQAWTNAGLPVIRS